MTASTDVAPEIVARLRSMCLVLPEAYEEQAWVGTRWRIRKRTFAHVLTIERMAAAYVRAAATDGPCTVLTFRSTAADIAAFRELGHPFFVPGWDAMTWDSCSAPTPTGARSRSCSPRATASSRRNVWSSWSSDRRADARSLRDGPAVLFGAIAAVTVGVSESDATTMDPANPNGHDAAHPLGRRP